MDRRRMAIALAAGAALLLLIVPAARRPPEMPDIVAAAGTCAASPERLRCLSDLAARLLDARPLPEVLPALHAAASDPAVSNVCHLLGHELGQAEYRRSGDLGATLGHCDNFCYGSCYHGAAEAFVVDRASGLGDDALAEVARAVTNCRTASCEERVDTIHGVGHAFMFLTSNDLPRALELCDRTAQPGACHIGTLMSNIMSLDDPTHPSAYIRRDDPSYPCRILGVRYQAACYKNQADFLVTEHIEGNIEFCRSFPEAFRESCYLEVPKLLVQRGDDRAAVAAACGRAADPAVRQLCIEGVVVNLHGKHEGDYRDMAAFCALVTAEHRPGCYRRMGAVLANWLRDPQNRSAACATIPTGDSVHWCNE
ncbi:MAG: hypothetical protein Q8R35_03155 [bacterium]|nr:hypothetical protein [bacterium]